MESTGFTLDQLSATLLLGLATIWLIYWYSTRNHGYWKKKGVVQAETYPFVGSMYETMTQPLHLVDFKRHLKYGKIYGHYEGNCAMLSIADPGLLKNILIKDFNIFNSHRVYYMGDKILDNMLFALHGEKWKRIRSIVSPTFTTGKIRKMTNIFKDCAYVLIKPFKLSAETGEPVDVKRVFGGYTMDVIGSCAFSTKIDSFNDPDNEFVKNAKIAVMEHLSWRSFASILFPKLMRLFGIPVFPPSTVHFFSEAVFQILEERRKTGQTRNDFLQLFLDTAKDMEEQESSDIVEDKTKDIAENYRNGESFGDVLKTNFSEKHLSFEELVAQSLIFFIGGFEPIAKTIAFCSYLLALNEDVQEKVIVEVDQVLQEREGELTYEAVQSMKYLDNVISETLRIFPIGTRIERMANADYKLGDTGITIPKRMTITIPVYVIHRDPNVYPDPEKFDPERFNPEQRAKREPFTYIPFGAGPRNCVAMRFALIEVKTCLAYLISNFRIKKCPQTKVPLEFKASYSSMVTSDITLRMELRKDGKLIE